MLSEHTNVKAALETATGLTVYYELFADASIPFPAITYMESGNNAAAEGDTLAYSNVTFTVKIWADQISQACSYAEMVDQAMREMGYRRESSNELTVGTQISKILTYVGLGLEEIGG